MIYLDNAATSHPKPREVSQAMTWSMTHCGNPGRSGHSLSLAAGRVVLGCRQALADFLNVQDPFQIVFCYNCTDALNMAIRGMVHPGGHVVTTAWEHNSVLRPLFSLVRRGVITWTVVEPGENGIISPEAVRKAILPKTCLAAVNQVSNVTGVIQPVKQIAAVCREFRVPILVDGAQAAGHVPVDLADMDPDLYAFPGHKGLLGPQGTGALFIGRNAWPEPLREGGTGSVSRQLLQPDDMPDRYESGTLATPCLAGLWAGVEYLGGHIKELRSQSDAALSALTEGLRRTPGVRVYGPEGVERAGVVSFNIEGRESTDVAGILAEQYDIACRPGFHCAPLAHRFLGTDTEGTVRMSPGPFTTDREIQKTLRAVNRIASRKD